MNAKDNNCLLLQDEYSLLYSNPDNPNEKIEGLADYIARVLEPYKNRVYYFTLPLWNYEEKIWEPNIVGRFYNKTTTEWEKSGEGVVNMPAYNKYVSFFEEAQQYFTFIQFFTNDIEELPPQFSIIFNQNEFALNKEKDCISFKKSSDINDENNKSAFINVSSALLGKKMEVSKRTEMLEGFYKFLCVYLNHYSDISAIYLFPSLLFKSDDSSNRYISSGGVILVCRKEIDDKALFQRISIISNLCFREIGGKNWARVSRNETIKSAKAAIMSRNMSHNLGSHVMSYLKNHLGSVQSVLSDRVLSRLIENESDLTSILDKKEWNVEQLTLPFLVGLGHFISYLQERQDFIATIATDYIPYYSTVNFKDSIYDELNNDKRFERHQDRKNLKPDNILLGNIARSEGLGRQTCPTSGDDSKLRDIVIKFRTTFTGDPVEVVSVSCNDTSATVGITPSQPIQPSDFYGNDDKAGIAKGELQQMRKYEVSLPGGIVGRQAVFSIVENVIRNAAKHGNWRKQGKLEFTIDIFSEDEVLSNKGPDLEQRLRDDQADMESLSLKMVLSTFYCKTAKSDDDYYFVTLTDNLNVSKESLILLRRALIENYIDEKSSRMKESNKGIKEMRISAAWLRSINDDIAFSPFNESNYDSGDSKWLAEHETWSKRPPVLYARLSKDMEGRCNLQYIFCLMRSKKVAFISPNVSATLKEETILKEKGWRLFTPQNYIKCNNKSFEIIVYDDDNVADKELYKKIRLLSPKRFIKLSELQDSAFFDKLAKPDLNEEKSLDEMLDKAFSSLYEYLSGWTEKGNDMIFIHDAKAQNNYKRLGKKSSEKIAFEENVNAKYRYVTHLETKQEFETYVVGLPNTDVYLFSEGITGDNSTDRLVRNEDLTDLWFYKHLYAMKQNVAIFDERIFSKVYGLEENDLIIPPIDNYGTDLDEDKKALKELFFTEEEHRRIDKINDYSSLNTFAKIKEYDPQNGKDINKAIDARNHLGATYAFKNLFVFTIIRSLDKPESFNLIGYQYAPKTDAFSQCVKYATLSWDKDNKMLKFDRTKIMPEDMKFSLMSIHQGLLDKLYGVFDIKDDKQNMENLTKSLYEEIIGGNPDSLKEDKIEHYILPGMTIHSGRSKPSKDDMPQWIPFIPYSALEHAVLDCKYALVELLDSARYE